MATKPTKSTKILEKELVWEIQGAVYEVYRELGHGFLEKVYEKALLAELAAKGLSCQTQVKFEVKYKTQAVGEYFADLIVDEKVVVELKAKSTLTKADEAQLLNYLKVSGLHVGLLVNFCYPKAVVKRLIF